jgi:Zn-dependent metalloprotease
MKHFNAKLIFALLVFSINVSLLNAQRHFYLNLSKQCLSAESALTKIQQEFEIDPNSHFKLINDTTDRLGMQHLTYKQYLYDFEIVGCMVLVHAKKGVIQSLNGIIMEQELLPSGRPSQTRNSLEIEGKKVYILIKKDGKSIAKLAIKQLDKKSQSEIYLDASTGDTLRTISMRNFLDGNTNAKLDYINYYPYKEDEEIEVLECEVLSNNLYSMRDSYRDIASTSTSKFYPTDLGIYAHIEHNERNPECEILWGLQKSYNYFYEQMGTKECNNKNCAIRFDYRDYYSSTYSEISEVAGKTIAYMHFGFKEEISEEDGRIIIPLVSLDIVAHEYSHLVISKIGNGGLKSYEETGALCESFADIFASAIMNRHKGNDYIADYLIGEEVALNAKCLRSLAADCNGIDGTLQPQCYHGKNWDAYYNDFGTNSGVQNRWFYLLCNSEGKVSGTNDFGYEYEINPITLNKGEQIVFRNLNFYLTPFANYHDAAMGSLQATADLYGINSDEFNSVLEAWCAVGICLDDRIADIAVGMPTINPNLPLVYAKNGEICIKANPNSIVKIFTPIGMLIEQRTTKNDLETFTIPNLKIAIVMVNNDSFKIIIP